jgi:hypothetical protein
MLKFSKNPPKVNNSPKGEHSPNLVTLFGGQEVKETYNILTSHRRRGCGRPGGNPSIGAFTTTTLA